MIRPFCEIRIVVIIQLLAFQLQDVLRLEHISIVCLCRQHAIANLIDERTLLRKHHANRICLIRTVVCTQTFLSCLVRVKFYSPVLRRVHADICNTDELEIFSSWI